jgi:hypothetical protein
MVFSFQSIKLSSVGVKIIFRQKISIFADFTHNFAPQTDEAAEILKKIRGQITFFAKKPRLLKYFR